MFTALLTVTVPAVFAPSALKSVASTFPLPSLTVIVITSSPAVDRPDKLANEVAAILPVTTPFVLAAIAFSSATVEALLISTVAEVATTKLSSVTNAAVTSSVVPWMFIALLTVTCPDVFSPIALKSVASTFPLPSVIVTNAVLAVTLELSVTNASVT